MAMMLAPTVLRAADAPPLPPLPGTAAATSASPPPLPELAPAQAKPEPEATKLPPAPDIEGDLSTMDMPDLPGVAASPDGMEEDPFAGLFEENSVFNNDAAKPSSDSTAPSDVPAATPEPAVDAAMPPMPALSADSMAGNADADPFEGMAPLDDIADISAPATQEAMPPSPPSLSPPSLPKVDLPKPKEDKEGMLDSLFSLSPPAENTEKKKKNVPLSAPPVKVEPQKSYKTQVMSDKIYKKNYNYQNRHLPPAYHYSDYSQQFFRAVERGDINAVRAFLNHNMALGARNLQGDTPLLVAAKYGRSNIVQMLLARGANPNELDHQGLSALHAAALSGNETIIEALANRSADMNIRDNTGRTPLMYAVQKGNMAVVRSLLKHKALPNTPMQDGKTALHIAASAGNIDIIEQLLAYGADVDAADSRGLQPYHYALHYNRQSVLETLRPQFLAIPQPAPVQPMHMPMAQGQFMPQPFAAPSWQAPRYNAASPAPRPLMQ